MLSFPPESVSPYLEDDALKGLKLGISLELVPDIVFLAIYVLY
jgi:hypothetical protein